jgi:hypothetical protein
MGSFGREGRTMRRAAPWIVGLAIASSVWAGAGELPEGWIRAGSAPADYEMGMDTVVRHTGRASAFIEAKGKDSKGFGTLMQTADPGDLKGKRVRLSAYVKSEKVDDWAGLWFRVDGEGRSNFALAFDNMQDRPIKGTNDWTRVFIVLDVPQEARALAFGILMNGSGRVWMDDLKFEVVGTDVPVTGASGGSRQGPQNLDFEG